MIFLRLTIAFLAISLGLGAQSHWTYYSNDSWVQDIKVMDNLAFIGNPTGFRVIDIQNNESKLYQSVNSSLRGSFVWELLKSDDHIWIALDQGGIARYDISKNKFGDSFQQYYTPVEGDIDTLHRARNLIEDDKGRLWFDSGWDSKGFLYSIENGIVNDHTQLFSEQPRDFSCHGSKRIYFRDDQNPLNYFDLESSEITTIDLPANFTAPSSYTALNDKLFAIFSDSLGNYIYQYHNEWKKISDIDFFISLNQAEKGHNKLWINDYQSDPKFFSVSDSGYQQYTLEELAGSQITPGFRTEILHEEKNGRLWLNTMKNDEKESFVYSIKDDAIERYGITHSSLINPPYQSDYAAFDCEGNLIIPRIKSVQLFKPDTLISIDILEDRMAGDIEMVAVDPLSCRWFIAHDGKNTDPSFIYVLEETKIIDTISLPNGWIGGIVVTKEGKLFTSVSQHGIGIYDLETEQWTWNGGPLWNPELNRNNGVWSIREHANGAITFGTTNSLVLYNNGEFTTFDASNSPLNNESIFLHYVDSKGHIFVGYEGGLYKYDGNKWEYISFYDPFENAVYNILEDERGNFWLATLNSGLLYWNGFSYQQFDIMNSAIPSNKIYEILRHPISNNLWLITDRGIVVFDQDDIYHKQGIYGKVYFDAHQDGIYDPGFDTGVSNIFVDLEAQSVISDINGNYSLYLENHDSVFVECLPQDNFIASSPTTLSYYFEGEDIFDANFGFWKEPESAELDVDISISPFLCSTEISIWITLTNPSGLTTDGTANLSLPHDIEILNTYPEADNISDGLATWSFEGINYLESRSLYAVIKGPSVEDILMANDSIKDVIIDISATVDYNGIRSQVNESVPFLCAYDPNDKLSSSTGQSQEEYFLLKDDIEYTIRFQNEGNFKATNVIITDTLSKHLDYNTIEIVSSSHPVQTHLKKNENTLIFRFIDINLPPKSENEAGSQGFVKFRISPKEGLENYTTVINNAQIYFDNNSPIITNYTDNILVEEFPTVSSEQFDLNPPEVKAFPNPSRDEFQLLSDIKDYTYTVYSARGEIILNGQTKNGYASFEIEQPGLYIVTINFKYGMKAIKVIRL